MENIIQLKNLKNWFMVKEEMVGQSETDFALVKKETEKAVLISIVTSNGLVDKWIPKSVILTDEEAEAEVEQLRNELAKEQEVKEEKANKREIAIEVLKENGVKGIKVNSKTNTIVEKIQENGLVEILKEKGVEIAFGRYGGYLV